MKLVLYDRGGFLNRITFKCEKLSLLLLAISGKNL